MFWCIMHAAADRLQLSEIAIHRYVSNYRPPEMISSAHVVDAQV